MQDIIKLSKNLIAIPSISTDKQSLHTVLNVAKKELSGFTIEEFESNKIPSFLTYVGDKRPEKFKVILNAHLDVVPGKEGQYRLTEKDGKLFGRGTYDMKVASAVEIILFKELVNKLKYPIALQLVTDEEIGGFDGAKHQIEKGVSADFIIAGEGTNLQIKNKSKGIIWATLKTKGKTAHGAYLWNGENAIWKMEKVLEKIKQEFPVPERDTWVTTINVASIETSNKAQNKVPEDCTMTIDVRFIPEDRERMNVFFSELEKENMIVEYMANDAAQFTPEDNEYITQIRNITKKYSNEMPGFIQKPGGSDIRHYTKVGINGIEFGPVGEGLHTDNEWVTIKSLTDYYNILKEFLIQIDH